jgi:hypothetical protein
MRLRRILDALEIPFDCSCVDLAAIVEEGAFAQFEGIGQEILGSFPLRGNTGDGL